MDRLEFLKKMKTAVLAAGLLMMSTSCAFSGNSGNTVLNGDLHQSLKLLEEHTLLSKELCRSVETSIDSSLVCLLEKFQEEVDLQKSLTTTHRDAAIIAPIAAETLCLVQQVVSIPLLSHSRLPRIWIVTELAAHRTSLQENQEPNARPIYRAEAFYTMNESSLHLLLFMKIIDTPQGKRAHK